MKIMRGYKKHLKEVRNKTTEEKTQANVCPEIPNYSNPHYQFLKLYGRPNEVYIVSETGEVGLNETPRLEAELFDFISEYSGTEKIIINLSKAGYVDTSGVAALILAKKRAESRGLELVLEGLEENQRAKSIFEITRQDKYFGIGSKQTLKSNYQPA